MKKAILMAINDYSGTANDLKGCVNDALQWKAILTPLGFECVVILNSDVTRARFASELEGLIKSSNKGDQIFFAYSGHGTQVTDVSGDEVDQYDEALYLHDGPLIDDKVNEIVLNWKYGVGGGLAFDSCFSGTGTRDIDKIKLIRFHPMNGVNIYPQHNKRRGALIKNPDMNYVYLSGCSENQTSADAFINGDYHGAFTYHACNEFKLGISYKQWHDAYSKSLRRGGYEQSPQIEGNEDMMLSGVFGSELVKQKCWLLSLFK